MDNYRITHSEFHQIHDIDMKRFPHRSKVVQFMIHHQSASTPKLDPSLSLFLTSVETI